MAGDDSAGEAALKVMVKGAGISFIGLAFSNIVLYATRLVLARALTPDEYGLLFLALSIIYLVMSFVPLGLDSGVQRYAPYYLAKNDMKKTKGVIVSSVKMALPISILTFLILFIFSGQISLLIFHDISLSPIIAILSITLPFFVIYKILSSAFFSFKKVEYDIFSWSISRPVVTLAILLISMFFGFGLIGATAGYTLGFVASGVLAFILLESKVFRIFAGKIKAAPMGKTLLAFSLPLVVFSILWNFMTKIDTILLGMFKTSFDVGIYQTAVPTTQLLLVIPGALGTLFLPVVSELLSKGKKEDIGKVYETISKWIFYTSLPLMLVFIIYPNAVINILFGFEYIAAGNSLRILSVGYFIFSMSTLPVGIISLFEKTKYHILNTGFSFASGIFLNYLLIPVYGIDGAALASAITLIIYTTMTAAEAYVFSGSLPMHRHMIKALISGAISILVVYFATKILFSQLSVFVLAPMFVVFIAMYALLLLILKGVGKEDIMILKAIEAKTGLRIKFVRNIIKKFI
jgi:O-antigen/teichoic acid export membrane protein